MALQDSGSGTNPAVSMSAKDINNELGEGLNAVFDFGGAAASFSGITDDTAVEMLEFYNKTFGGGTETYGSRPTLVANYYGYDTGGGDFEIYTFTNSQLIQTAENDISGFFGGNADALNKTVYHTMNNNATFDTGDYIYDSQYSPSTPSEAVDWTDPDNHGADWDDTSNFVDGYMVDTTNNVIFKLDISNGEILALRSRTPSTPTAPENAGGATATTVGIQFTSNTEVTDTFKVYKSTTSGGTYSEHTNTTITSFSKGSDTDTSTSNTITINGLASSTDYFFKVTGVNDFATGTQSSNNDIEISTTAGGGGNGFGCFAYGTQILMSDGTTKNIEEMMVGDVVKSMSIPDMPIVEGDDDDWNTYKDFTTNSLVSSSLSTATVKRVRWLSYDNYYKITLGNGDILKATYHHPLFVQRDGVYQWTKVNHTELSSSLKTTDLLVDKDKNTQTISSIDYVNEILDVATLDVENLDVYFANNYLVHNKA